MVCPQAIVDRNVLGDSVARAKMVISVDQTYPDGPDAIS
jgi:hypothetical protein